MPNTIIEHSIPIIKTMGELAATVSAIVLGWSDFLMYLIVDWMGILDEANLWLDTASKVVGLIAGAGMAYYWWFRKIFKKKKEK